MIKLAVLNCYERVANNDFLVDIALSFTDSIDIEVFKIAFSRVNADEMLKKENIILKEDIIICQNSSFTFLVLLILNYSSEWNKKAKIIINNVLFEDELKNLADYYVKTGGIYIDKINNS